MRMYYNICRILGDGICMSMCNWILPSSYYVVNVAEDMLKSCMCILNM
jgi:hypothetical protein